MADCYSPLAHMRHVESEGERRERELFIVDEVKIMKRKGFETESEEAKKEEEEESERKAFSMSFSVNKEKKRH